MLVECHDADATRDGVTCQRFNHFVVFVILKIRGSRGAQHKYDKIKLVASDIQLLGCFAYVVFYSCRNGIVGNMYL
jgi:hypothetical protein